eukprot:306870-Pelagomonas_calceolata.AAC.2
MQAVLASPISKHKPSGSLHWTTTLCGPLFHPESRKEQASISGSCLLKGTTEKSISTYSLTPANLAPDLLTATCKNPRSPPT